MKYNNTISIIKAVANAIMDPTATKSKLTLTDISNFPNAISPPKYDFSINPSDEENFSENVPIEDSSSYVSTKNNDYYSKKKNTTPNPQGIIDSIANELTPVRLQQAIILSEIVGKPKSKTRKRRRF